MQIATSHFASVYLGFTLGQLPQGTSPGEARPSDLSK